MLLLAEKESEMKLLITGFDPFGKEKINPAFEAVKILPNKIQSCDILKEMIPTVFNKAGIVLLEKIDEHKPDIVISVGQAGGRHNISIERVAINLRDARIEDNDKNKPCDEVIVDGGDNAYFSNLPVKKIVTSLNNSGIPATESLSAGSFVCNEIMYVLLHAINTKYPNMKGGFIHVPFALEQAVGKAGIIPTMSINDISRALEISIKTILKHG